MGIIRYYDVKCDSCRECLSSTAADGPHECEGDAEQSAEEYGWRLRGKGIWACPGCLDAMKEDHDRGRAND